MHKTDLFKLTIVGLLMLPLSSFYQIEVQKDSIAKVPEALQILGIAN